MRQGINFRLIPSNQALPCFITTGHSAFSSFHLNNAKRNRLGQVNAHDRQPAASSPQSLLRHHRGCTPSLVPPLNSLPPRRTPSPGWTSVDEDDPDSSGDDAPLKNDPVGYIFSPRLEFPPTPPSTENNNNNQFSVAASTDFTPSKYDRDEFKEDSRVHFRTTFDFPRWAAHRSTRRYVRHLYGLLSSRMLRGLAPPVTFMAALSTVVALTHTLVDSGSFGDNVPQTLTYLLQFNTSQPISLTSTVLGLLLVFRTNASYARWLDGRRSWGSLVNRSRDFVRQGLTWLPDNDAEGQNLRGLLCRWVIALSVCLKCHLREGEDAIEQLGKAQVLPPHELQALAGTRHRPNYALQVLSSIVKELHEIRPNSSAAVANMDVNLTQIEDMCGTCERILKTPIPLSYTRHTSRFMLLWLSLLPFALWEPCRWGMVPMVVFISLLTLGCDELGVAIEEPFSILALEQFCATIKADTEELYNLSSNSSSTDGEGGHTETRVSAASLVERAKLQSL